MTRNDLLSAFVGYYRENSLEQLSDGYVVQLGVAVSLLERFFGDAVKLADLSDDLVNRFCDWLSEAGRAPDTVRGRRNSILCLWREAFQLRILDTAPARIRRIRAHRRLPQAWTQDEVFRLIDYAVADQVAFSNGVTRGLWFGSLVAAGWDTALRLGDLLAYRVEWLTTQPIRFSQHKTGDDVVVTMSQSTVELAERLAKQTRSALVWPLWANRREFYVQFRKLRDRAGITRGSFKWLRRASITAVEAAGGNGSIHAGHRSRQVTERHYIDTGQLSHLAPPAWHEKA